MEVYVVPITIGILGVLGGGLGVAAFNWLTGRRKMHLEVTGLQDEQTIAWRDNALKLSEALLLKDKDLLHISMDLHNKTVAVDHLIEKLNECLEHKSKCNCDPDKQ